MSRELSIRHSDARHVYFVLRKKNQAVIVSTHLLGDYLDANWATYAITGTEVNSTQSTVVYTGDVPSGLAKGCYTVEAYERIGTTAAITDYYLGSATVEWSGTAEMTLSSFTEVTPESVSTAIEAIQDGLATEAKQDAAKLVLDEVAVNAAETLATALDASGVRSAIGMAEANLDTQLNGIASDAAAAADNAGTGARVVTIEITDGTNPLESALVRMANGTESYVRLTNASGIALFSLDDATWVVSITKAGYSFTPTTLAISADTSHAYAVTAVAIPASDASFITGYLYCYDKTGIVESNVAIHCKIVSSKGIGSVYDTTDRIVMSDGTGLATITNMVPGATYQIGRGTSGRRSVVIPSTATSPYQLPDILGTDA
jgi:hypothetical protein